MPIKMLDSLYYSQEEYEKLEGMLENILVGIGYICHSCNSTHKHNIDSLNMKEQEIENIINWWNEYKSRKEKE